MVYKGTTNRLIKFDFLSEFSAITILRSVTKNIGNCYFDNFLFFPLSPSISVVKKDGHLHHT